MSKAISPDQVAAQKAKQFPDFVFNAFNELIASNFSNGRAIVYQNEVIKRMLEIANNGGYDSSLNRDLIFSRGYLNVEEVYCEAGWSVTYDKPGYNENYKANFLFKKK